MPFLALREKLVYKETNRTGVKIFRREDPFTQIILVRHGQPPGNKDKIFRGSRDIPLNDQGRKEARLAGEWLKGESMHAAYASPRSRARDTAHAIARHHSLPVADLPGLTDLCYGDWQGMALDEVKVRYADLYRQWETAPATVRFPGGETLDEVRDSGRWRRWRRWCAATPAR